ncbi:hypothetical protein STSP2_02545 [Anaerohalosphaera lusitana]|uniref:Uncharacterized protein n=1 Tax=Anaerohalosphaera lusitana TaxID=1936003 RepID=A0A1U9NPC2_9BACT|nr:hypothetical protein [Anaerohalosphaera lusitana]AQT69356.1 hypothetical protein STSP2_02545 [Anaerohalosphaera lusitana]
MAVKARIKHIGAELKSHAPFTFFGALLGVAFMLLFKNATEYGETTLFRIFHPMHVVLSAMVTASLFKVHKNTKNFLLVLVIGWVGALGVATLSDSLIPYMGETVLGVAVPTHGDLHEGHTEHEEPEGVEDGHAGHDHEQAAHQESEHDGHDHGAAADVEGHAHEYAGLDHEEEEHGEPHNEHAGHYHDEEAAHQEHLEHEEHAGHGHAETDHEEAGGHEGHDHDGGLHIGFIEDWYIVNPAAILGVVIAFWLPATRMPHGLHVLISTWASSAHMLMNTQADFTATLLLGILIVLFLAVWLPCCISDIVFPLLFVKSDIKVCSHCHGKHHDPNSCEQV